MRLLLKLLVCCSLIVFLAYKIDVQQLYEKFKALRLETLLIGAFVSYIAWGLAAYRWKVLLPNKSFRNLLSFTFIGQFYGLILPGQLAGEAAKAYRLGRGRKEAETVAASVFVDRVIGVVALLFVTLGGVLLTKIEIGNNVKPALAVLIMSLIFSLYAIGWQPIFLLIKRLLEKIAKRGPRWQSAVSRVIQLLVAWRGYLSNHLALLCSLILGGIFQLLCVWINVTLSLDLGITLAFVDWCWIIGIVSVAALLPVSIGGVGVREVSYVGVLDSLGVPAEQALALSLAMFSLSLLGAATGGIIELINGLKK